jgi:putative transposase
VHRARPGVQRPVLPLVRARAPASGIGLHTPADVHYSRAHVVREARGRVLDAAYLTHPERFVRKAPEPPKLPGTVWINKPEDKKEPAQ